MIKGIGRRRKLAKKRSKRYHYEWYEGEMLFLLT